ncbi:probable WRKY transcription factor 4 [Diospyros lotus]|uniref:probable WRKY transcription factor 4 n=1 Tax=Diospyros lotus TaxID=55363 RepID=UPI0022536F8A|nr:probable WRKY transcription factor 4 [Diospyros lotus]
MAKNEGSSSPPPPRTSSSASLRPSTITLPPRGGIDGLFAGLEGFSPGPMTLVSSFFSDADPYSDCRSFSQLLAGAMASPAARPDDPSSRDNKESGDFDFRFKQNRPSGLMVPHPAAFGVPPGLSPAGFVELPGWFSPTQGAFGMSHQQALLQVTAQAAQVNSQMHNQVEFLPSLSAAPAGSLSQFPSFVSNVTTHQQIPPAMLDPTTLKESSDLSLSDHRSQPSSLVVDKPTDDGFNWRKYGQKQVKGSEYPRSYYKCTHPNCPVKKKVERSLDGHITEIIYKGQHNHEPPQPSKRAKSTGNLNENINNQGNSEFPKEGHIGNLKRSKEGFAAYSLSMKDQESSQATPECVSGSGDSEEEGADDSRIDERLEDEPEAKRRNIELRVSEPASSQRTVTEPRIIVQTTSEVDLLDDGYRWRKYGQKVVKGNPYPRSYYKCTYQGCNVRKHIERAASDPKAVITTYEGKHNHDVPAARNSSHNMANNISQLRPQNALIDNKHTLTRQTDLGNNNPQPIAVLRLKEELT